MMDTAKICIADCIGAEKLDGKTTDGLFNELERLKQAIQRSHCLTVEFGEVSFVSTSGLTWLLAILCGMKQDRVAVQIVAPTNQEICAWLEVMGFFQYCAQHGYAVEGYVPQGVKVDDSEEVMIEVTPITNTSDVSRVTSVVLDRLKYILKKHLDFEARDVHNVCSAISEACDNILDHSEGEGVVAVQSHTSRIGIPFVAIGVADAGVGIRRSLGKSHPEIASWADSQVIEHAFKKGISGRKDEDRGFGLNHIREITRNYHGRLQIRSGTSRLSLVEELETYTTAPFRGTQLCLTLSHRA